LSCGKTEFLPYILDPEGKCIVVDNPGSLSDSVGLKSADKSPHTLLSHLKKIFKQVETLNRWLLACYGVFVTVSLLTVVKVEERSA